MPARTFDLRVLKEVPSRLRDFAPQMKALAIEGASLDAERVIAIVGTREPGEHGAQAGTRWLAAELAKRGFVIASGGAVGIDAAAHEGALSVGGITWAVIPSVPDGPLRPPGHAELFRRIIEGGGSLVYTLDAEENFHFIHSYHERNEVLAALSDTVVATQAPTKSGTHNTCTAARRMNKAVWVVPPNPWLNGLDERAAGNLKLLRFARPLHSLRDLIGPQLELFGDQGGVAFSDDEERADPAEKALVALLTAGPKHPDELVHESGLSSQAVSRALLTLSLDTVVVDGPDGRYRRCR